VAHVRDLDVLDAGVPADLQDGTGKGANCVLLRVKRDNLDSSRQGQLVHPTDEGGNRRHLADALGDQGERGQESQHRPGIPVMGSCQGDELPHPTMAVEFL